MPEPASRQLAWDWCSLRRECFKDARRLVGNADDAEEAVQEALVRAWRCRGSCREPDSPLAWMRQITRNESMRLLARRKRRQVREGEELPAEVGDDRPVMEGVLSDLVADQAMSLLRPQERTLLRLRYMEDLSQPEVARRLGLPEGTVKVQLHRVRNRLRDTLIESH